LYNLDFARSLLELESSWLRPRLLKLGGAPNLLLTSLDDENSADFNLHIRGRRLVDGELKADPQYLPFADASFGGVLLQHVLEWCAEPDRVLRECDRVLMPGGRLVVLSFNPFAWSRWYRLRRGFRQRPRLKGLGSVRHQLRALAMETPPAQFLAWPHSRFETQLPTRMHTIYTQLGLKQPINRNWIGSSEVVRGSMVYG
jgi:SAM-dependent methyltransferase